MKKLRISIAMILACSFITIVPVFAATPETPQVRWPCSVDV